MNTNINLISLTGRLGQVPEVKYFESGSVVAKFSVADKRATSDVANWWPCEAWGKTAEVAGDYCASGSLVSIKGELIIESWTDSNTGAVRTKPIIKIRHLELISAAAQNTNPALATGAVAVADF